MNIKRNIRLVRKIFNVLDLVNIVLSVVIIVLGIFIFVNISGNKALFPVLFLMAFVLNLSIAFRAWLNDNKGRYIIQLVISAFLLCVTFLGFIAV
ncbi:hypothetical protein [Parasporobacterium paucivorans]|uniref:Uncharacterized protein n=1 Tax=Parasporobacterium paucivorans DSM 15970 TaxID=1122934 RepID=A0A1M6JRS2_9FIRM|nr:hypothetical protein [Parasporobacterium paucivorans]SHJ49342.1 hypothetical protein SAMN02745691_02049 [Parasporobacterium paucivorans DSM 15970]